MSEWIDPIKYMKQQCKRRDIHIQLNPEVFTHADTVISLKPNGRENWCVQVRRRKSWMQIRQGDGGSEIVWWCDKGWTWWNRRLSFPLRLPIEELWCVCFAGWYGTVSSSTCQLMLSDLSNWETHSSQPLDSLTTLRLNKLRITSCTYTVNVWTDYTTKRDIHFAYIRIALIHRQNVSFQIIKRSTDQQNY